ncbi:MAG: VOC family protein [Pseudomonadales bacterium]|nr:VOC family protein [Pseudomonadales bacterium]
MQVKDPLFILYVRDMDRAVAFWRDTFELEVTQHTPGWSMLRCGGATIALHILGRDSSETVAPHAGVNLHVDDLDAGIASVLAAGGEHIVTREPTSFVPVRMCELRDTEGNGFELRQFVATDQEDLSATS